MAETSVSFRHEGGGARPKTAIPRTASYLPGDIETTYLFMRLSWLGNAT
jgi:hypothetical protein